MSVKTVLTFILFLLHLLSSPGLPDSVDMECLFSLTEQSSSGLLVTSRERCVILCERGAISRDICVTSRAHIAETLCECLRSRSGELILWSDSRAGNSLFSLSEEFRLRMSLIMKEVMSA